MITQTPETVAVVNRTLEIAKLIREAIHNLVSTEFNAKPLTKADGYLTKAFEKAVKALPEVAALDSNDGERVSFRQYDRSQRLTMSVTVNRPRNGGSWMYKTLDSQILTMNPEKRVTELLTEDDFAQYSFDEYNEACKLHADLLRQARDIEGRFHHLSHFRG